MLFDEIEIRKQKLKRDEIIYRKSSGYFLKYSNASLIRRFNNIANFSATLFQFVPIRISLHTKIYILFWVAFISALFKFGKKFLFFELKYITTQKFVTVTMLKFLKKKNFQRTFFIALIHYFLVIAKNE